MTISNILREHVRQRANYACEFCGISETDTGGQLTVDHFQPRSKGGTDDEGNLFYCCTRCNLYKSDYWPDSPNDLVLWNSRQESIANHFVELVNGQLHPLTSVGTFTLKRLRLNRPLLVAHRLRKRQKKEAGQLLARYRDLSNLLEQLLTQPATLLEEQRDLLQQQQYSLELILKDRT